MSNVNLSGTGPGEVRLPAAPPEMQSQLDRALAQPDSARREAVAKVVAANPRYLDGWAWLGALGRDSLESYMAFRIGYHRGLDTLRANGWKEAVTCVGIMYRIGDSCDALKAWQTVPRRFPNMMKPRGVVSF